MLLFGGYNGSQLGDTWTWNGATWTQQNPAHSPAARSSSSMVYDAATQTVVLFSGSGGTNPNDTWTWNGTDWTLQAPAHSPPYRYGAAMAYDAAHGTVVLFGGTTGALRNDTWTWNGTDWTQQSPTTSPSARRYARMDYDAATGNIVLFGGATPTANGETWTWNGSTWTQQTPAASPAARYDAMTAYDAATSTLLLFGGYTGSAANDTWAWNGTTWTQRPTAGGDPFSRYNATMSYDAATGSVMLFGGQSGATSYNDTWNFVPQPAFGSVAVGSTITSIAAFTVTASGTLGTPVVLTQGAPNLDFTLNPTGTTCTGAVTAGTTCNVVINFAPTSPGHRLGAVELVSTSNAVIGTFVHSGIGTGPLATFTPGAISTVAGNGTGGYTASQDTGTTPATAASINSPGFPAFDGAGNLYIPDTNDDRVRKVTGRHRIHQHGSGNGTATLAGDNGAATAASLNNPYGVAVDGAGNLYIGDYPTSSFARSRQPMA